MPGFIQNTNQPNGPNAAFGGGMDFSGQLNDMLAPYNNIIGQYQQMAKPFQSPYMTMSPNSWLARNHPQVAGVLDNAFLTGAMTPQPQGPEGVGGGISRAMQGLMGGVQARRQQMIQSTMLPFQMAGAQLGAMDVASQIGERRAMIPFRMAQERRYDAQADMYYNRMMQADRQKALAGPDLTDDKGGTWSRVFDPISGATRLYNPVMQKHADELPPEQQPSFVKEQRSNRISTPGGLAGEIIDMRMSSDPAIKARGEQMADMYKGMVGGLAGARTGAEQAITQPPKDLKTFVAGERTAAYNTLPKPMTSNAFQTQMIDQSAAQDPAAQKMVTDYWKNPQAAYERYLKGVQSQKQQIDIDLSKYEKSAAPRQGVSFSEYIQNRSQWDGSAPEPAPEPATSGTGSTWTPSR